MKRHDETHEQAVSGVTFRDYINEIKSTMWTGDGESEEVSDLLLLVQSVLGVSFGILGASLYGISFLFGDPGGAKATFLIMIVPFIAVAAAIWLIVPMCVVALNKRKRGPNVRVSSFKGYCLSVHATPFVALCFGPLALLGLIAVT